MEDERSLMDSLTNPQTREEGSNQRAMIAGATPLLVGLLTGNTGDAVEISAKGLMAEDARKREEDKTLLSYLRKKQVAGQKKSDRLYQVRDQDTGDIRYVDAETAKGGLAPMRRRSVGETIDIAGKKSDIAIEQYKGLSKHESIRTNPITGLDEIVDKISGTTRSIQTQAPSELQDITPKQRTQIGSIQKEFGTEVKKIRESIDAADEAMALLMTDNPVAQEAARFKLAKVVQGAGVLTDRDVDRLGGSKALKEKLRQAKESMATGKMSKNNIKFMKQMVTIMKDRSKTSLSRRAKEFSKTRSGLVGTDLMPYLIGESFKADVTVGDVNVQSMSDQDLDARINELQSKQGKK